MWSPCSRIIKNFKIVTAEHSTRSRGQRSPCVDTAGPVFLETPVFGRIKWEGAAGQDPYFRVPALTGAEPLPGIQHF